MPRGRWGRRGRGTLGPSGWASCPELRYPLGVRKIIREILTLLWKVLRLVLWKWLKPRLGRYMMYTVAFFGLIVMVVYVLTRL